MKLAFVITCNNSVEHVVIGSREQANAKMGKMKATNYKATYPKQDIPLSTYEERFKWDVKTAPLTNASHALEMN
jgi:hypothetical protein